MNTKIVEFLKNKIGLDKAIAFSSGGRIISAFAGVGSVFFISTFLTGVEQGFYFTFGSILALQVFFELGLTGIMTQYVAHEASHLTLDENSIFQGEDKYRSRLSSLLHFCVKWYTLLAIIVFIFLTFCGIIYFNRFGTEQDESVEWFLPWIILCIAVSFNLFISPLTSILSGLGFIKQTSKISFFQQIFTPLSIWTGLFLGCKLYVAGFGYLAMVIVWLIGVKKMGLLPVLTKLWKVTISERVDYWHEIFPYQWKIALSWVSGYFIYHLFNPVLFATEGAVVAGQMGMTLQALNAISAMSLSWLNTKVPLYSKLIALKDYVTLDNIFNKTLKQMGGISIVLLVAFYLVLLVLKYTQFSIGNTVLADRFLYGLPLILLMITIYMGQYIGSWATYLRCHKQEPFLVNSIVVGLLCLASTFFFGYRYGLYGVTIGYFCVKLVTFPWGYYVYYHYKNKWHGTK